MKTNFKRIGKQSISIVLAVMMMLSTMLVGMVTSNAAISYWVLRGTFNDWKEIQFGGADGGSITYDLSAYKGQTVEFRTDAYEDGKLFMNSYGDKVVAGTEYQLKWETGTTMKYTVSSTGTGKVTFTVKSQNGGNYLTVTEGDQPITVTPYYVAGETSLVNGPEAWKAEQENDKMSYDETTEKYSITYDKKAAGTYKFKIIEGSSTWHGYNDFKSVTCTDENCTVSDVDGEYHNIQITTKEESNITITLDSTDSTGKKLIISAEPTTQKYTVAVDKNITNGTVTPSATSLAAGKTFTVTATPNDGYELDTITVTDAEGKSVAATNESTHTYTMPASNVTVSATFAQKPDCRLGFGYATGSSDTMGTFSCSSNGTSIVEGTYPYGTEVTFNAVAKEGYVFKGWYSDINGTSDCLSTNTTYTFKLTKETDVFAKFAEATGTVIPNLYLIYSDSTSDPSKFTQYLNLYRDADGQVYAYFDSEHFDSSKTYCFTISDSVGKSTSWEYAYDNYNNSKAVANEANTKYFDCGDSRWGLPKHDESSYVNTAFARFRVLEDYADTISSVKVNLGYYKGTDIVESSTDSTKATTYEIIPDATGTVSSRVKVYAKDGTVRTAYQKYADMADTVISYTGDDVTKKKSADYYEEGYAKLGSTITVTTTIDKDYRSKYYVKAFCVNGYSYGIIDSSKANADGVYSFEYTIPEDCTDKFIEITPIYYYIDDTDTVTFYVEGFDETVQKKWGNTVAVQAWYTNGVDEQKYVDGVLEGEYNSPNKNALGGYPGQPLVYEGGKYSMQIPKYLNGNKDNFVKGITLNNYIWDSIHSGNFKDQINDNCQTYDYDDFYKLSETNDVDNIIFDFRYRTTTDNKPSQAGLSSSTYNKNELEPLKDYYGNIVDIFGNILSKDWTATYDSNYLTVISNGYKEIKNIGKYATEWSVYDKDGTYITTINCSSLIDETKVDSTYQAAYKKLKSHAGLPVKIAYEKSIFQGPDNGTRADGRWYFSKKAQKISANVKIEYKADGTSPFVEDAFVEGSNVGVNTKAQAYFTNADSNGKTTCQGIVDGGNFSVHAQTDVDANYYFIGWYLKTSDGYSFITNESDADFPMTNNATYIARFIPTPSGTLTLSHTLLTGSADGKTFIKADIVDSKGNVKASIAETSGNLVVPARYVVYTSEYSIKATLRTVPYGNDTVEDFYNSNEEHYNSGVTGTGEKTYEVSKTIKELFESYEDVDHNTSYRLIKSNIPFYSNIKSNPLEYTITYTYETRLDGKQSYVIKDKVSGIELEEMWAENVAAGLPKEQLSKAFITKKAPFVSNFRNEIKWDIDHAVINGYIATVDATTKSPDLTITALAVDGGWTKPETVKYGELAVSNGDYLYKTGTTDFPAQYDYNGATKYDFSFWAIFDNREKAAQYSKEVATYMSGNPAEVMSDRLTALTQLDGYDNLISKSYSKEYNYVSYQNYYIVPVYAGRFAKSEINESQASIRLLEYTRNQWTTGDGVKGDGTLNTGATKNDYLYTDFALSFDKDQELIKNNANIKVGVTFEVVAKYNDINDLKSYETTSNKDAIGNLVKAATANGKVGTYKVDSESADRNVYRYEIKNSNISVKNRIEYYLRFKNSETSQQNVMKVYSYIYDTVSGKIYLSDPVYMNMYDIGNLTYITSDLANINLGPDATV
ncbi:InlB B-repeat-containing protein [uncultured Ruminococcus sp.]|uniref:InlB B-repeat-containing protein n=1 Tax=uncultured Ruminococcus sp. TaxID=165186 RepID=UPI00265C9666|nr:InlB B-repeat-containing protein [uncultured Ruminococcus sp.]